jgi:hypothetical protein
MKDVRDIRLLGIGFVAGMVLCYFLTLDAPQPPGGTVTMTLAQAAARVVPVTNQPIPGQLPFDSDPSKTPRMWPDQPTLRKYGHPLLDIREAPDFKREQRLRIEPALKMKDVFPGGVPQYDLIDLNYQPDFKLPPQ